MDIVVSGAAVDGVVSVIGVDAVGVRRAGDPVIACAGDEVLELGEAFAGVIGRTGHHVDGVVARPMAGVQPVDAGAAAQRLGRAGGGVDIIVAALSVIDALSAGTDAVISGAAIDRVATATADQAVIAVAAMDIIVSGAAIDGVVSVLAIDPVIARTAIGAVIACACQDQVVTPKSVEIFRCGRAQKGVVAIGSRWHVIAPFHIVRGDDLPRPIDAVTLNGSAL